MSLRIVGAGLGRTGTTSLKAALEILLGAPCYHMFEVFQRPKDIAVWHGAVRGHQPDWSVFFQDYRACVDWPGASFWKEIANSFPDSLVLLSLRKNSQEWFTSSSRTIFRVLEQPVEPGSHLEAHFAMVRELWEKKLCPNWNDAEEAMAAYERHNAQVRAEVEPSRLIEWQPGQGWEPLCEALKKAVPEQPFPHLNTTPEFRRKMGLKDLFT
jgi:Sulfotransferase domain